MRAAPDACTDQLPVAVAEAVAVLWSRRLCAVTRAGGPWRPTGTRRARRTAGREPDGLGDALGAGGSVLGPNLLK